ncbi:alpha-glucuronidase [Sphingomonas ginkgonis]|uniref:Xylan alpha-1,2-glucuronidase n=1 Tax=Sphingomonas ginkgonis TaxID=2315330 RepID=A0A3R9WPC4_9SPHN|nr:alpha-glucuronidase family glycosyl hydrolase [Sphingomonas ginkgonis]RST30206.1 alpha-glucuronidase [Sphingomonas ginkgonis]
MTKAFLSLGAALLALSAAAPAQAEDGYRLWLRYEPVSGAVRSENRRTAAALVVASPSPLARSAHDELRRGIGQMLGRAPADRATVDRDGAILLAALGSPMLARTSIDAARLGAEGYAIRSVRLNGHAATLIAARDGRGLLYGSFALLRRMQMRQPLGKLDIVDAPRLPLRMLDHWDNLDRSVERGYAGQSLWDWQRLPLWRDPRIDDYARANASVGINAAVLNNVNGNADILTAPWLAKVATIAGQLRPWGMRVFLSARFSAPREIGGLPTADPLDPRVRAWWKAKADEIYAAVPDFGGFLVKANSEGQPGPQDYHRTHADGANMLAEALAPHGGTVIWRAFVYAPDNGDRAKQAFAEFQPLDGRFARNVIVQVKNGPIDFQPREPFSPLFGAMPRSRVALEVQVTKEYLGFATHLAYLGTMWEEVLRSRTDRPVAGARVADTLAAMAGVANAGTDRNWSGSQFDQANWYAFGRLAWNPDGSARSIAEEWVRMTWGNDPRLVDAIVPMMMGSRQAVVDYMTPLGLAHLMGTSHHYGPAPWVADLARPDWNPVYYHRAGRDGIGFDRTATGSNAVAQYAPEVARRLADRAAVGDDALLWFHHVPWTWRLDTGRTLWAELVHRYDRGVATVVRMRATWDGLRGRVDPHRHAEAAAFLAIQEQEARWWRDACLAYFQSVSGQPLPAGTRPPAHPLAWYEALRFPYAPGQPRP